jgi:Mn-dependent DtxR family transcriptional regulator
MAAMIHETVCVVPGRAAMDEHLGANELRLLIALVAQGQRMTVGQLSIALNIKPATLFKRVQALADKGYLVVYRETEVTVNDFLTSLARVKLENGI